MKAKFLFVFLSFTFLAGIRAEAQGGVLPLNNTVNGTFSGGTPDIWDISTTSDGFLKLSFNAVSPADLFMTLYDNNGTTVLGGPVESFNNSTVIINSDGLAPGTYHVKITPFGMSTGSYTIIDSFFTSILTNDPEPNRSAATADVLPLNSSRTGHVGFYYNNLRDTADWYKVTTTSDGLLRVYLTTERSTVNSTNITNPLDVNVILYDNDGTTQLGFVEVFNGYDPATNMISTDGLAPGTYYIKVEPFSTQEFANYTISDSLFTPPFANDSEPNGTAAAAVTLPVNSGKTGHVGYYYNNLRDTADWYKVTTTADGLLRVYLTSARGSVYSNNMLDLNMTLYDNNGTTQLGFVEVYNAVGPATNFITADGLAPGTYYIKVEPFSTQEFADYTISDSLFTPPLANDSEPNGTATTANILPLNSSSNGHVGYYYNNLRDTTDWYKVTTTADGLLRVYLTSARGSVYSNNMLDVNMTLYDNDGTTQLGFVEVFNGYGPATNMITKDGLAPGTYYVKVQPFSTQEFADYTISDSLFTPPLGNDAEPNGTTTTATLLPVNSSKTGHVGYYYNNQRDTTDWYKVTTTTDGELHLSLTTARGSAYSNNTLDVIVTVYDNTGTTQLGNREVFNGNGPATDSINITTVPAGTYYIKVRLFSSDQFADYTLTEGRVPLTVPVVISTSPAGLKILVDGLEYGSQVFHWVPGSSHTVSTTSPQTSLGTNYVWYNWTDGGAISHPIIAPSVETTYTANFETQLAATATVTNAPCYGSAGSVSIATSGGTAPFIFYLKNSSTGNVLNNSTGTFTNIPAGVYFDSIVDANHQYVTGTVTISQPAQVILPAIVFTGGTTVCSGSSLSLSDAVTGGQWSSSNVSLANVSSSGLVNFGSPAAATQVTISYTVAEGSSCSSVISVTFTINTSLSSGTIKGNSSVCVGNTIQLTNDVSGGIWSSNNDNVRVDPANGNVTGITAGSATVSYTVGSGTCTSIATFLVSVEAMPIASDIKGNNFIKKGFSIRLTDAASGGIWSCSNTHIATISQEAVVKGIGIGNCTIYYVVSNSAGCSDTAKKKITVYGNFIAKPVSGNIICNGGTTTITVNVTGGSGLYRYRLNGGKSQSSNMFTVTAGTYLILVEDIPFKRLTVCLVIVRQPLPLVVVPAKETNATSGSSNGSFTVRGLGGNPPYHFSIDGGSNYQDSGTFNNLAAGSYNVSIKDANGCIALNETTVNVLNTESKEHAIVGVDAANAGNIKKGFDYSIQSNVYPNPAQSYFTIDLKSNIPQKVEIQVFDLLGQIIYETKGDAPNSYRFGQNFGKGVYFVKIIHQQEMKIIRIIKE